ncbi:MAG: hypothetical protein LLF99_09120 [Desulfobacteraceae bacterium]|nr:hypothetical protein [Desulfobacteraceae bacterium]
MQRKRILVLYPYESNMPGFINLDTGFRKTLTASKDYEFEFYVECMDLTRFPDERYHDRLMELYREKYSIVRVDLIVADLRPSLKFLSEYSPESFKNVPVILCEQDPIMLGGPALPPVAAVVTGGLDIEGTMATAMRLHPGTRRVYVVTGASRFDQSLERMTREALRNLETRIEIRYLSRLSMDDFVQRLSSLPENSLVLYISLFQDGTGRTYKSPDALAVLSSRTNTPIYSVAEPYMGSGIVGGRLLSYSSLGAVLARVALRVLAGEQPGTVGPVEESASRYVFDARELRRWGIGEESLPEGSEVRYRTFSAWETYRWRIVGFFSLLIVQALLISALVVSLRKRRRIEYSLRETESMYRTVADFTKVSEEFNRSVLASLKSRIVILDGNGFILAANEAWERFPAPNGSPLPTGLSPGGNYLESCRQSIRMPNDSAGQALNGILSVLDGKSETFSFEYVCDPPFESRWFTMKVVPFRNPGGGVVVSHSDISQRKAAELEAQMRREELTHMARIVTVGELASSLAHEINQPMTAILCNSLAAQRFLSGSPPDLDEVGKILVDIVQDGRRAGEVIRRLRTLVKKDAPRRESVTLGDVVGETVALVQNASLLGKISIVTELDSRIPPLWADRVQLQQVVLNMLMNAIAAMSNTPPALRVLLLKTAMKDGRTAMVSIKDSGTGIGGKDMAHIFEPFFTTKPEGLGMGLSISRTIVKAHGGAVWAENNREGGATFYFTLPVDGEAHP